jgi:hypothetical protein
MAYPPSQRSPSFDWPLDGWKIGVAVLLFAGLAIWWWQGIEMPVAEETNIPLPLATSQTYSFGSNVQSQPADVQTVLTAEPSLALTVVALVSAVAVTPPAGIIQTPTLDAAAIVTPTSTPTPTSSPVAAILSTATPAPSPTPISTTSFEVLGAVDAPLVNSRPALVGMATPGAILVIDMDEKRYFVEADASGEWIFVSPAPLPAGTTTVRIGRPGPGGRGERDVQSLVVQIAEDAQPIPPPTLDPLLAEALTGRAPAGMMVQVYARLPETEPILLAEAVADESGRWSAEPAGPLTLGDYAIWVVLVAEDGEILSRSAVQVMTIAEVQP